MGDFSYSQAGNPAESYGQESFDYSGGYGDAEPSFAGGYQDEVAALVPENVPILAAILMEQRVMDHAGLERALARQQETGDTLVQVLLDTQVAAADQVVVALQSRALYR